MLAGTIRPEKMLEYLIGANEVELLVQDLGANVELGIVDARIGPKTQFSPSLIGSGRNFQEAHRRRIQRSYPVETFLIHYSPLPVGVVDA